MPGEKRILWADDEPGRLTFEARYVRKLGSLLTWKESLFDAIGALRANPFDGLILDQMLPFDSSRPMSNVWSGCLLLRWLRGTSIPAALPPAERAAVETVWTSPPLTDNASIPVMLVSGIYNETIQRSIRESAHDRELHLMPKPTNRMELRRFVEKLAPV